MKEFEYIDESTFKKENIEFSEEHCDLTESLHEIYKSENLSKCSPVMVGKNKKSLLFCVNLGDKIKDRTGYERGDHMYRIIIEKI